MANDLNNLKYANIRTICEMIIYRYKQKTERKMWDLYVAKYQHMDKNSYVSFEEFYNVPEEKIIEESKTKTDEQILDEVAEIRKKLGRK